MSHCLEEAAQYQIQAELIGRTVQHVLKGLSHPIGNELAVGKGKVGCTRHGLEVVLALLRFDGCTAELSIRP